MKDVLSIITTANGFNTDAGLNVTTEPAQIPGTLTEPVLALLIEKQQRPADAAAVARTRLTTLIVAVRVPADLDEAQDRLDDVISDVEAAMDRPSMERFPVGVQWPRYVGVDFGQPLAGLGWNGALITYQTHIPIR